MISSTLPGCRSPSSVGSALRRIWTGLFDHYQIGESICQISGVWLFYLFICLFILFLFLYIYYLFLSYYVAVIQCITSCHKNNRTTRVVTLWRVQVTSTTTSMSTMRFLIEKKFVLKAIKYF